MADGDWWDVTWNPVAGCKPISPGCKFCWSPRDIHTWLVVSRTHTEVGTYLGITTRLKNGRYVFNGKYTAMPAGHPRWTLPLHLPRVKQPLLGPGQPLLIAVCITSDLFLETRPIAHIERVIGTIASCEDIGLILTRRAAEMAAYFLERERTRSPAALNRWRAHIWLGSAEDQQWFDLRWPPLRPLAASGWTIFCSYSPILGPLELPADFLALGNRGWVICAGEKAPDKDVRPMDIRWVRDVFDQCRTHGVPFFMRQLDFTKRPITPDLQVREFPRVSIIGG
jgi:protein gp37